MTTSSGFDPAASGPRIGLWGRFDVGSFGDLIVPRVFENEIRRRLPRADVQTYAPLGPRHPIALDGGHTARALGVWSRRRAEELAQETDCIVVGGGDVIHTHEALFAADYAMSAEEIRRLRPSSFFIEGLGRSLERRCPVAWNAVGVPFPFRGDEAARLRAALGSRRYLSVRDAASRKHLLDAGVEERIEIVPDPSLLAGRAFRPELLLRRLDYLKFMDWFPRAVEPLVLQGAGHLAPRARSIARSLVRALAGRSIPIVLLETESGRDEGKFLDAIAPELAGAVFRVPPSAALSDVVAVLAHARAFVGTSSAAAVAASAFGVPVLRLGAGDPRVPTPPGTAEGGSIAHPRDLAAAVRRLLSAERRNGLTGETEKKLERHFDRLAEIAESSLERRSNRAPKGSRAAPKAGLVRALRDMESRIDAMQTAYASRSEQMLEQRFRLVEALEQREAELRARLEEARAETSSATGTVAQARADLEASRTREIWAQRDLESVIREKAEIDALLAAERQELERLRGTLETEVTGRERLLAEFSAIEKESLRLASELARAAGERDGLAADLANLRGERDGLEEELRAARERRQQSEEERDRAGEERDRAEVAARILTEELDRLHASLTRAGSREARLRASQVQALSELAASLEERERASGRCRQLETIEEERERELRRVEGELQRLHSQLLALAGLKVFRYSAPLRAAYGRLRRLLGSFGAGR